MRVAVKMREEDLLKYYSDTIPNQGTYFFAEQNYQQKVILHRLHVLNPSVFLFICVGNIRPDSLFLSVPHSREAASLTDYVGAGLFQLVDALIPLILLKYISCLKMLSHFLRPLKQEGFKSLSLLRVLRELFGYSSWELQRQQNIFVNWGGESLKILSIIWVFPLFFSGEDASLKGTESIYVLSWTYILSKPSLWGFTCRRGRSTRKHHFITVITPNVFTLITKEVSTQGFYGYTWPCKHL